MSSPSWERTICRRWTESLSASFGAATTIFPHGIIFPHNSGPTKAMALPAVLPHYRLPQLSRTMRSGPENSRKGPCFKLGGTPRILAMLQRQRKFLKTLATEQRWKTKHSTGTLLSFCDTSAIRTIRSSPCGSPTKALGTGWMLRGRISATGSEPTGSSPPHSNSDFSSASFGSL